MSNFDPRARPLAGAHWDGTGVTFMLASRTAQRVDLCWFDHVAGTHETRLPMVEIAPGTWSVRLEPAAPGLRYGFRVHGPWQPDAGLFHNPAKLLLDPYARAIDGPLSFHPTQTCWTQASNDEQAVADARDSAAAGLRSVVIDDSFDWQDDHLPKTAWSNTLLYECHVKGMTALHPRVTNTARGLYLGLCAEPIIEHLRGLGVTALSLMPIAASATEQRLVEAGLVNYWGYQPIACFAPTPLYASAPGREVVELKTLVRELHRAGIEVLLDVVLNHTAEGSAIGSVPGPSLCLRGIDSGYYRRDATNRARDENFTGCGNTLDLRDPLCLQLAIDCLRYWADTFHVDGFRLDLAPVLGRDSPDFNPHAPLLLAIQDDPLLRSLKWIAEPWDLGPNGYCLGRFPAPIREWNDRFREAARHYVRCDIGARNELTTRLSGSADVFHAHERTATSSINYITAHDGFTLWDLVSHSRKHNEDNAEHNRDGRDDNTSHHWGVEGETDDPVVIETRRRVASALLTLLACAQGVPMLSHGDELGRTQRGNNNAYCQDGPLTYVDWEPTAIGSALHQLVRDLFALRRERPSLRVEPHCHGELVPGGGLPNLSWLSCDGRPLTADDWNDRETPALGMLRCHALGDTHRSLPADIVLALWNPALTVTDMRLPSIPIAGAWTIRIDTAADSHTPRAQLTDRVSLSPQCAMVLSWDERA